MTRKLEEAKKNEQEARKLAAQRKVVFAGSSPGPSRFARAAQQKHAPADDADAGWATMRRRRRGRNPPPPPVHKDGCCDPLHTSDAPRPANWREDHVQRVHSLRGHPWCAGALAELGRHDGAPRDVVICYGLGSTYESWNARHQLAFLVLLAEACGAKVVQLHDPFLSADEVEALEGLGIEAARPPKSARPCHGARSLYFMPHCPAAVYADVLRGFAPALDELLIVGNSFGSYARRRVGDDLHPDIRGVLPRLRETRLDGGLAGDALERPFGDLAAMSFERFGDSSDEGEVADAAEAPAPVPAAPCEPAPTPAPADEAPAPAACEAPAPAPTAHEAPAPACDVPALCEAPAPARD